jgi:hypothetical protein
MDWGLVLGLIALICVCLPCRWDPAIRWKEKLDGWPKDRDADKT